MLHARSFQFSSVIFITFKGVRIQSGYYTDAGPEVKQLQLIVTELKNTTKAAKIKVTKNSDHSLQRRRKK